MTGWVGDKQQRGVNFPVGYAFQTHKVGIVTLESWGKKTSFQFSEPDSLGSWRARAWSGGVPSEWTDTITPLQRTTLRFQGHRLLCSLLPFAAPTPRLCLAAAQPRERPHLTAGLNRLGELLLESGVSIRFLLETCVPSWNIYLSQTDKQAQACFRQLQMCFDTGLLTLPTWVPFGHMLLLKACQRARTPSG